MLKLDINKTDKIIDFGGGIEITIPYIFNLEQAKELDKLNLQVLRLVKKISPNAEEVEEKMFKMTDEEFEKIEGLTEYKWKIYEILPKLIKDWNVGDSEGKKLPITLENIRLVLGTEISGTTQSDLMVFATNIITHNAGLSVKKNMKEEHSKKSQK